MQENEIKLQHNMRVSVYIFLSFDILEVATIKPLSHTYKKLRCCENKLIPDGIINL